MPKNTKKTKGFRFKPFSRKQNKLLHWWRKDAPSSKYDIIIIDGAIRSGKTIACICSFLTWSQENFDGQNFILAGKTIGSLKRNVIGPMLQILTAWGWKYDYVRSGEIYLEIRSNKYYLYGASTEAAQDTLQGLTAAGALADEAALFPRNFIDQMIGRCSVDGAKIFMNCNPGPPSHYLLTDFIRQAEEKMIYHLHFTMDDNLSLSPKKKAFYRRMYTGVFFKRYILGEWAATDGLVYQQFADQKAQYIIDAPAPSEIMYAVIGLDFGGTKSAHSITLTGFTRNFQKVIVLDEYYHDNKKDGRMSPKQLEDAFVDFVRRALMKYRVYEAYCDSAEQTLIEGLTVAALHARLPVEIRNAQKRPINDRIAFYNSMIAQDRFRVVRHCKAHIRALEEAVYDDSQAVKDVRLDNGTTNIDSLDSMEYSTESVQDDILYFGR